MTTAVDTNALLAILYDDEHADESERVLRRAYGEGALVVAPIVEAELAGDGEFTDRSDLDKFLSDFSINVTDPSPAARFTAGGAFARYVDRRPDGLQCPACGAERTIHCENCGDSLSPRQHVAADFLIGGHAAVDADALVSFDSGFYETYFPSLTVYPE